MSDSSSPSPSSPTPSPASPPAGPASSTSGSGFDDVDPVSGPVVIAVHTVDDELVSAFDRLIPQLSSSSPPPTRDHLMAMVDSNDTVLFVARLDGHILGSLTLAFYRIPTGLKAWIEDVVVDDAARGRGIGALLNQAAIDEARARGAKDVNLSSRPSREAANRLYRRMGFVQRDTNIYRFTL